MKKLNKEELFNLMKKYEDDNEEEWFCYDIYHEECFDHIYEFYCEAINKNIENGEVEIESLYKFSPMYFYFTFKNGQLSKISYTWDPYEDDITEYEFEIEETEEAEEVEEVEEPLKDGDLLNSISMLNKLFN